MATHTPPADRAQAQAQADAPQTPVLGPQPLRSALKNDDDADRTPPASGSLKAVQIADPVPEDYIEDDTHVPVRRFRAGSIRKLSGRPPPSQSGTLSSRSSVAEASPALRPQDLESSASSTGPHHHRHRYYSEKLLAQVGDWLERERNKSTGRTKSRKPSHRRKSKSPSDEAGSSTPRPRADSMSSQASGASLDTLQRIIEDSMASFGLGSIPKHAPRLSRNRHSRRGSRTSLHRTASSDTDYVDGDAIVPSCDALLDNSKTMSYGGGSASTEDLSAPQNKLDKDREAWLTFKNEIIRITHTLRLKGWRKIPMEGGDSIDVQRLSGALTNAVYVVTPPDLSQTEGKKAPAKLLLRIYGPQVEHLIDRDTELQVLRRLARKKIGPRLLGTFQNGRFEQFFNAATLTRQDLRDPETSKQIAKRMRELHEGMELLPHERDDGPAVWNNTDKWLDNVGRIATFLDKQLEKSGKSAARRASVAHAWMANGYICGVPWPQFRDMVSKYRRALTRMYPTERPIPTQLVFAHNDTQYGNILRFQPDDEKSPLLQPANKHKQLIVIDFEYAAANVRGYEFANHFIEWTYNYHDPATSWQCNINNYPTEEEQHRFLKSYVDHHPQFPHASSTPRLAASDAGSTSSAGGTPILAPTASSSSIVDFMLDARVPPGGWNATERAREEKTDEQVRDLVAETRLWRPASSVFWTSWGIVQAKVPGLETPGSEADGAAPEAEDDEDGASDEFDYLSYAQDRAMLFWGDCVGMGLVKLEELPQILQSRIKLCER